MPSATAECPPAAAGSLTERAETAEPAVDGSAATRGPRRLTGRRSATLVLSGSIVASFLAASAAPTPLYDRYEATWHASAFIGTIAFGVYALAVIAGLLFLATLADHLGRRRVLAVAVLAQALSLALFAVAGSFAPILIGRVLQGLAAGAALGTLSAAMIESDSERGPVASAAAPSTGTALGAIGSGLIVSLLPGPTHTIYLVLIAVLLVQALAVAVVFTPAAGGRITLAALRPRIAIPPAARVTFAATSPITFAAWSIGGFDLALSPALYQVMSGDHSVWHSALPVTVLAAAGTVTSVALARTDGDRVTVIGALALLFGLAATIAAVPAHSVALVFVGSAGLGAGFGAGLQGPIRMLAPLATNAQRPGLMSALFAVAYLGLGLPAVVAGALVSSGLSLTGVTVGLGIVLAVLTAVALAATLRGRR